jgi:Bacterial SH3 domain
MMALRSPGRLATAVGLAVAAVGATVMAVTVAQAAPESGRCTDNVNVREHPDANARIVGMCRKDTRVTVDERRSGFVKLHELNGWASERYVESSTPRSGRPGDPTASSSGRSRPSGGSPSAPGRGAATGSAAPSSSSSARPAADDVNVQDSPAPSSSAPAPRGGLGGLFG